VSRRQAEDGIISKKYPLQELIGGDYLQRTRQNVIDSDRTLIIYFSYLLVDADEIATERAAKRLYNFSKNLGQAPTLNIAGPRESMHKDAYCYTRKVMSLFFKMIEANDD